MSSVSTGSNTVRGIAPTLYVFNKANHRQSAFCGTKSSVCRPQRVAPKAGIVSASVTCSAVVDRPHEVDLHSVDLGWPRGFPSRYALGEQLGRGSFGTVYLATDRLSGEEVAAKVIPKERKGTTREHILEKIQQEVDILRRMQGREEALKLVSVYEDDDQAYVITEACHGGTLEHFLRGQGALTEQEAARVTHNIVSVLAECHRQHICYADVKPANFLLKHQYPDPRVLVDTSCIQRNIDLRVADFGCSQHVNTGVKLNKKGGTPLYMAPELFMRHWDIESDMWALGMLLYQMLVAKMPFWSSGAEMRDPLAVMSAILSGDIDFSGNAWAGVSSEAMDLCKSLLDRDYNTRISAAQTLAHPWLQEHCRSEEECVVVNDVKAPDLDHLMAGDFVL
ncbi:hypothetical protein ABBQ32_006675 [Trebouxia sp. C0010 RCD-2024]